MDRTPYNARTYTLDGEYLDLPEFIRVNGDDLEPWVYEAINAMEIGDSIQVGGGAGATFIIARDS